MKVIAEIFSQGEEVVCGQIVDSNAAWLSQHLNDTGFSVKRHTAVGDDLNDLVGLIKEIAARADCCICTGGLGPTIDDLTAEAAAIASGQALTFDEEAMCQVAAYFNKRQRPMPDSNRKQAYFPQSAKRIDNPIGSAPGFALQIQRCYFVFLPGVPSEMKAMFPAVQSQLQARFELKPDNLVTLRTEGIGESTIQQLLHDMILPAGVQLGFRASPEEVQTKLVFPADFSSEQQQQVVRQVADRIGDYVFAIDGIAGEQGGDLLTVIDRLMSTKDMVTNNVPIRTVVGGALAATEGLEVAAKAPPTQLTGDQQSESYSWRNSELSLATLETASGGLLAAKCHGRDWLASAMIAKDLADAASLLNVRSELVEGGHTADFEPDAVEITEAFAVELKRRYQTDLALVQLLQGPLDDYRHRDRNIVIYNGLQTDSGFYHSRHRLSGAAQTKQNQAALLSLDLLRRYLQNKCH